MGTHKLKNGHQVIKVIMSILEQQFGKLKMETYVQSYTQTY